VEKQIVIESPDGTFGAYISRPTTLPAPVVVVLQELFGVNADIRATCDELAAQGYIAIAPDLFWRQEPDVDLDVRSEADWQHGLRLYGGYDRDAGARDIAQSSQVIHSRFARRGRHGNSAKHTRCKVHPDRVGSTP
jgi:carboxymethylenebutenolidase